ncbi:hypothetical protein B9Z19DRAFT_1128722 [Tuber borchii]|uniref:Uncharacterized protein n=1 Tax=Tuber borchii TaxID=42251 RepID=A0A2T6ZNP3_TUBBO|nr:hypothetical protein B9Z19DRAFT_1128722 [Tuber borchii]
MASIFVQPARRLVLRSGTRAFSMSRTGLLKPSASLHGYSTDGYGVKPRSDLDISKDILQKRMDLGILQLQMKEEWNRGQDSSALISLPLSPHEASVEVIF